MDRGRRDQSARLNHQPRITLLQVLLILSLLWFETTAQTTSAACVFNSTTSRLFNSAGESPCLVWSKLQSLCIPSTSYINVPPLLDPTWAYNSPNGQSTQCQCNVVSYSLMAGCTFCQWGSSSIPSEQAWSSACQSYDSQGLVFNETAVDIPGWAFHTWQGVTWDPSVAFITSSPSPTSYTTTLSRSFPSTSITATRPSTSDSSSRTFFISLTPSATSTSVASGGKSSASKWGPVVGGVVGAMILVLLIVAGWTRYRLRSRKGKQRISRGGQVRSPASSSYSPRSALSPMELEKGALKTSFPNDDTEGRAINPYRLGSGHDHVAVLPEGTGSGSRFGGSVAKMGFGPQSKSKSKSNKKKQRTKTKRIPYPYPSDTGVQVNVEGYVEDGLKSFLDVSAGSRQPDLGQGGDGYGPEMRPITEMIYDPNAFVAPRPVPRVPPSGKRKGKSNKKDLIARYTTTQERLAQRPISLSASDLETIPSSTISEREGQGKNEYLIKGVGGFDIVSPSPREPIESLDKGQGSHMKLSSDHQMETSLGHTASKSSYVSFTDTAQDFSRPLPPSAVGHDLSPLPPPNRRGARESENTLPSLYEPKTGAETWTRSTMDSPQAKYPMTEYYGQAPDQELDMRTRSDGIIGAALGSGTRRPENYWEGQGQDGDWSGDVPHQTARDNVPELPNRSKIDR
ncbi:hypothetical protein IAR55_004643 [Kwoniella newhampshirensis]|uniref:Transmembrane protein n=1 Tax=Kwoniella newhampshirensis TaxID=1651941 RepID=A0AAW0YNY9_9TREE